MENKKGRLTAPFNLNIYLGLPFFNRRYKILQCLFAVAEIHKRIIKRE
jgi:hypothetical protein